MPNPNRSYGPEKRVIGPARGWAVRSQRLGGVKAARPGADYCAIRAAHTLYEEHPEDDDYVQAGNLYRLMDREQKAHLISNLAGHMKAVKKEIQERQICNFYRADPEYGTRLGRALGRNGKVKQLIK